MNEVKFAFQLGQTVALRSLPQEANTPRLVIIARHAVETVAGIDVRYEVSVATMNYTERCSIARMLVVEAELTKHPAGD